MQEWLKTFLHLFEGTQHESRDTMTIDQIVAEALDLDPQARAFIAEKLIESLEDSSSKELSPAWQTELKKRVVR